MSLNEKSGGAETILAAPTTAGAQESGPEGTDYVECSGPVDNAAAQQTRGVQADVRANDTETCANLTHLPHLPHLPEEPFISPSTPPSSTSTREPRPDMDGRPDGRAAALHVLDLISDGSSPQPDGCTTCANGLAELHRLTAAQPVDLPAGLRPVDEIRADLTHAHTAALLQLGATTVGDGPIGRLLRDVEPLLAAAIRVTHTEPANPEGRSEEAILALCDAATPGPWYRDYDRIITRDYDPEVDPDDFPAMQRRCTVAETNPFKRTISRDARHIADAAFIAAARTDVPTLLAALAAARSDADQLRTENEELREQMGTERLVHRLQEQRLAESGTFKGAPRWDEDQVVIENNWLDGRCGRCGDALPNTTDRDAARVEVDTLRAALGGIRDVLAAFFNDENSGVRLVTLPDRIERITAAALAGAVPGSPPEPTTVTCRICRSPEQEHRGSTHHGFVPYRSAVVPGSPETRQEEQR